MSYYARTDYTGSTATLTNIAADGSASASFHSWPDTLAWDAYSGDYGPGFLGMVLGGGTYVVQDTEQLSTGRLLCYRGVMNTDKIIRRTTVYPRDAWQQRVFVGPLGLFVTIDAGIIESLSFSSPDTIKSASLLLSLTLRQHEGAPHAAAAIVWPKSTSSTAKTANYSIVLAEQSSTIVSRFRGGWRVPLRGTSLINITVTAS